MTVTLSLCMQGPCGDSPDLNWNAKNSLLFGSTKRLHQQDIETGKWTFRNHRDYAYVRSLKETSKLIFKKYNFVNRADETFTSASTAVLKARSLGTVPYYSDHKAHLKSFNFLKNRKCSLECSASDIWIWSCFLIYNQLYVVKGAIY